MLLRLHTLREVRVGAHGLVSLAQLASRWSIDTIVLFHLFAGPKEFFYRGHNYFYSGHVPALANRKVDWLDGRNICREYCMDLVSMETQEENNLIFKLIQQSEFIIRCPYTARNVRVLTWPLVCHSSSGQGEWMVVTSRIFSSDTSH